MWDRKALNSEVEKLVVTGASVGEIAQDTRFQGEEQIQESHLHMVAPITNSALYS